jgi:tRNA pseudouridine55 synthase
MLPLTKKKTQTDAVTGILLVSKPEGMTSHDVVDRVRRITSQRRVGHAGTLDPLAGGLLVVCLGRATKVTNYLAGHQKSYRAVVRLGVTSDTYDREGLQEPSTPADTSGITRDKIEAVLESFRGTFSQKVPAYSAVHVNGQRLHKMARRGQDVEVPSREVTISALSLVGFDNPELTLDVTCSKGTYIRSLAHDIGQQLGCGAYLQELTRTATDNLTLSNALSLEDIESRWTSQQLRDDLLTIGEALNLPAIVVGDEGQLAVVNGRLLTGRFVSHIRGSFLNDDDVVVKNAGGEALAVGKALINSVDLESAAEDAVIKYARVLA